MFTPFLATGIGSLPHTDPHQACTLILETCDIPFWPQLPRLSFREFMIPQFSEGMPFLKIDERRETIWVERNGDELARFYETYSDTLSMPVSERFARGFFAFQKRIAGRRFRFLKGHVTGPLTLTLGLKDNSGKPIYFDEELREIALLLIEAKIRWQIDMLKPHADQVILFIDEPVLSALGTSSYVGVAPDEAMRMLKDVAHVIRRASGIPGIHCCSKADWSLVIASDVAIISFDAYDYLETIRLYPAEFTTFLRNGGYLAWGIVPTTEAIHRETLGSLKDRLERGIEGLSRSLPSELLTSQILLTPSCGAGSKTCEEAEKIFRTLSELGRSMRGVAP